MKFSKIKILLLSFLLINTFVFAVFSNPVSANNQTPSPTLKENILNRTKEVGVTQGKYTDSNKDSLINSIALITRAVLSFLGTIFLILIIVSGYQWMMAGGNEEVISQDSS